MQTRHVSLMLLLFVVIGTFLYVFFQLHAIKQARADYPAVVINKILTIEKRDVFANPKQVSVIAPAVVGIPILSDKNKQPAVSTHIVADKYKVVHDDVRCMAMNMYHEARSEGDKGMLAVGELTMQRLYSPLYPNDVCEVVWQPAQFSWTQDGKSDTPQEHRVFEQAVMLAGIILNTGIDLLDDSVLNYHAEYVNPTWAQDMQLVAHIGKHKYYKPIKFLR